MEKFADQLRRRFFLFLTLPFHFSGLFFFPESFLEIPSRDYCISAPPLSDSLFFTRFLCNLGQTQGSKKVSFFLQFFISPVMNLVFVVLSNQCMSPYHCPASLVPTISHHSWFLFFSPWNYGITTSLVYFFDCMRKTSYIIAGNCVGMIQDPADAILSLSPFTGRSFFFTSCLFFDWTS